jgi:hypothetical protein
MHARPKLGVLRKGALFKDWVLPATIERIRHRLASTEDGNRQMVDIRNAVLTGGLSAVESSSPIVSPSANASASASTVSSLTWPVLMPSKKNL